MPTPNNMPKVFAPEREFQATRRETLRQRRLDDEADERTRLRQNVTQSKAYARALAAAKMR